MERGQVHKQARSYACEAVLQFDGPNGCRGERGAHACNGRLGIRGVQGLEVGEGGDDGDYEREAPPPSDMDGCDWDGLSSSFMT